MKGVPSVSVVIPVYRGAASIGRLTEDLIAGMGSAYSLEIVLVNDDSPDESEAVCIELQRRHPHVVAFYSLAKNVGEHNAVMAGLNQCHGDYVLIMDDDFQNPVEEARRLLDYTVSHDFDVVYTYYARKHHSFLRNLGSRFNDKVANLMLGKPRDLYLSSFKALNRFLVGEIVKYDQPFPYIDGLILRTTSRIGRLEVRHQPRAAGKSGYTLRKLVRLWLNMFTNFSILPLRLATMLGFFFSMAAIGFSIYTFFEKLTDPAMPIGYPTLLIVLLLFAGLQLTALGTIGEYIGRMFLSQNRKPQYTIRRSFPRREE